MTRQADRMGDPDHVTTRQELARFVNDFRDDLVSPEHAWENQTLDRYLDALAAWLTDMDGWFANRGETAPDQPYWGLIARMLTAAAVYA